MAIPWTKKYQPKKIKDILGHESEMKQLKKFVEDFKKSKKKAVIIYGPSGSGKTAAAYTLAESVGYEIIEVNASNFRNPEQLKNSVGAASKQMSLFSKGKVILIDEVDGLSGRKDRGGIKEMIKLIDNSAFPIILTSNNPWNTKFATLRKRCEMVQFRSLDYNTVYELLKNICENEKIKYDDYSLKSLARRAGGDLRGAITDLQLLTNKDNMLDKNSLDELSGRAQTESMLSALVKIFKTTDPNIANRALDNVNEDLNQVMLWIDENLPIEYDKPKDLAEAYDKLSRADVFRGRIRRWQHWRFMVYMNNLLTAGIAVSKDEKKHGFVQYKPTSRLLKLWWAKQKNIKKKAIAAKIAEHTHSSVKETIKSALPYYKVIFKKNKEMSAKIAKQLDLNKDEVAWLRK